MANAQTAKPIRRGTCTVCHGPITYYPRAVGEVTPNTISINDDDRWAHDRTSDWLHQPHRAKPETP